MFAPDEIKSISSELHLLRSPRNDEYTAGFLSLRGGRKETEAIHPMVYQRKLVSRIPKA